MKAAALNAGSGGTKGSGENLGNQNAGSGGARWVASVEKSATIPKAGEVLG